jgi:Fic family protein
MKRGKQGRDLVHRSPGESYSSYIPKPLPPDPTIVMDAKMTDALEKANRAIGRLDGLSVLIPDISLFIYFYVRKEAVLSSQIEGTQSSLSDLLLFESHEVPGVPLEDVQEVSNYVSALNYGMSRIAADAPLTLRLIREIHEVLLSQGRGHEKQPGEFRRSQNWIGGSRPGNALFVPPPVAEIMPCLDNFEKYLHDMPDRTPTLVKAGLTHVQFETIHPFLDGNGRMGRLLIPLLLCYEKALQQPLLYLSLYFKAHRDTYYELLQTVRYEGDWEEWLLFFLEGVRVTAEQATQTATSIFHLIELEERRIGDLGRVAGNVLRLHNWMRKNPVFNIGEAERGLDLSTQTVINCLSRVKSLGIVRETTGRQRNRVFVYDTLLKVLGE